MIVSLLPYLGEVGWNSVLLKIQHLWTLLNSQSKFFIDCF